MCGINGMISHNKNLNVNRSLQAMNLEIIHRGPDEDGFFCQDLDEYKVGFAMRRLSIIDLQTGRQPIFTPDGKKVIVFNGEIYNYNYLKDKYLDDYLFKTNSDTEVILALYERFGPAAFSLLDGMFSFSIFDMLKNKVFITRDYFGEKPLYYGFDNGTFYWASELKSILKVVQQIPRLSKQGLNLFFQLTYIPAPFTIYENFHKLKANHYIEFDCSTLTYDVLEIAESVNQSYERLDIKTAIDLNCQLVQDSVKSRSVSDVPIGSFLSGGVDSSIVSLCLAMQSSSNIKTFSIGFDNKDFDETSKARMVSNIINSDHHELILTKNDLITNIDQIILNFDEPFADSSALPTYLVAALAKQYVKVALTGDGGDEVYGGYNKYYMGKLNKIYTKVIPEKLHHKILQPLLNAFPETEDNRGFYFKIKKLSKSINYDGDYYYNIISLSFLDMQRKKILNKEQFMPNILDYYKIVINNKNNKLRDFREIDKLISLEGDMLVKVDRASMLSSLECRTPFLNKEIWNFTNSLPENFLLNGWNKKYLLKQSFSKFFPKDFLEKSKKGFGVPIGDLLRSNLKNELLGFIEKKFIEKQDIFNYEEIKKVVLNHIDRKEDNSFNVYSFYCFQKWYNNSYLR